MLLVQHLKFEYVNSSLMSIFKFEHYILVQLKSILFGQTLILVRKQT